MKSKVVKRKRNKQSIGFLHPNVDQHGGGEKVFWHFADVVAGKTLKNESTEIVIFCAPNKFGDNFEELLASAENIFGYKFVNLEKNKNIKLLPIKYLQTVYNSRSWPLTLLSMALNAFIGGIVCSVIYPVDIIIDTAGYPISFGAFARYSLSSVCAYIHYPFAYSLDRQMAKHSGGKKISLLFRKLYYGIVQKLYYNSLKQCELMFVNSSWTKARHVDMISNVEKRKQANSKKDDEISDENNNNNNNQSKHELEDQLRVLYPPCDSLQYIGALQEKWRKFGYFTNSVVELLEQQKSILNEQEKENKYKYKKLPTSLELLTQTIHRQWNIPRSADERVPHIVSIGQFRPEKDHQKQVEAVQILLQKHPELKEDKNKNRFKLVMCGGIVKGGDAYLNSIKAKIEEYGIKV
ncbi:MAG: hypothetical protein EZS28_033033 [Streblomastix strix]|uniref:ALG11 mannosyltransferase N-terminal domain-containing protein n=1 Tax=Streblomastix strix TaxID=222440 RepID=A0A5J4UN64_9EUKA|nr:MAG: hypothetical protein EZS28_033033 [Streblomastix strix]